MDYGVVVQGGDGFFFFFLGGVKISKRARWINKWITCENRT